METLEKLYQDIVTWRRYNKEIFESTGEAYYEGKVDAYDVVLEKLDCIMHQEKPVNTE